MIKLSNTLIKSIKDFIKNPNVKNAMKLRWYVCEIVNCGDTPCIQCVWDKVKWEGNNCITEEMLSTLLLNSMQLLAYYETVL